MRARTLRVFGFAGGLATRTLRPKNYKIQRNLSTSFIYQQRPSKFLRRSNVTTIHVSNKWPQVCSMVMHYSQRKTKVKERVYEQSSTDTRRNPLVEVEGTTYEEKERVYEEVERQSSQLTPYVRAHVKNVYATLAGTIAVCGLGSQIPLFAPALLTTSPWLFFGAAMVPLLGTMFTPKKFVKARLGMLGTFAALEGMMCAPLILSTQFSQPGLLLAAFAGTSAIFAGFTITALVAKRASFLKYGGVLFGGLLLTCGLGIAAQFLALPPIFYNIYMWGGLGIFSVLVAYDTQAMIERATRKEADVVNDSLGLFMNFVNIFIRLLAIMRGGDD
eukprot:TRINITY_DN5503_c0_g1_i1.p1 TRINITY_DN5503_c0_g1~~TRINITY_DN5503_c0_g1_i1.p1  ORF type:complete len:338 (+),score=30.50 TRINITY_DN5503_c0_g1_i1:23-1015(+)